jgi:hypothetical protein
MTRSPSRIAVICASLRVLPSMASEPWMVRMRLMRRSRSALPWAVSTVSRPTPSLIAATKF